MSTEISQVNSMIFPLDLATYSARVITQLCHLYKQAHSSAMVHYKCSKLHTSQINTGKSNGSMKAFIGKASKVEFIPAIF